MYCGTSSSLRQVRTGCALHRETTGHDCTALSYDYGAIDYYSCTTIVVSVMDVIEEQFGEGKSLYDVLEVPPTAGAADIKKAYFKAALKYVSSCTGADKTLQ